MMILKENVMRAFFASCLAAAVLFIPLTAVYAEKDPITDIKDQYAKTKNGLKELFHDRLVCNVEDNPWPSSGSYQSTYDIYYQLGEVHGGPRNKCVLFIQVNGKVSYNTYTTEYLFDINGKLIFYYQKYWGAAEFRYVERRYYFSNGILIRYSEDAAVFDKDIDLHVSKSSADKYIKEAQEMSRFFEHI
jgi:hypothetical protein